MYMTEKNEKRKYMRNYISRLHIKSFRGIKDLVLDDLQPINILTGDNNSGKNSVLEVIQSFENPGSFQSWKNILRKNQRVSQRNGITYYEGFYDLFDINEEPKTVEYTMDLLCEQKKNVVLSARESEEELSEKEIAKIQGLTTLRGEDDEGIERIQSISKLEMDIEINHQKKAETAVYEGQLNFLPGTYGKKTEHTIVYISPVRHAEGFIYLGKMLDQPELYEQMLQVLKEYDEDIISINFDTVNSYHYGTYKILSKSHKKALPLDLYGDGMKKAVLLMSAVIAAKDGILLLDEFETAIHTSAMSKTFKWILETCIKLNVQVFLTSHSKEAIDKLLKCSPLCKKKMAVYTLYKHTDRMSVRRLDGEKAVEAQDDMGLELR